MEVAAFKVAVAVLLRNAALFRGVCIHSDSRANILTLSLLTVHSKVAKECMILLAIVRLVSVLDLFRCPVTAELPETTKGMSFREVILIPISSTESIDL